MVVSDAVSFNSLYREQLEYLGRNGFELFLICGGDRDQLDKLRLRNVGSVYDCGMVRRPHLILDVLVLIRLFLHFLFNRYDVVVVSTPKAILLGSIAAFFSFQRRRVVFFQGRVYENFRGIKRRVYVFLDWLSIFFSSKALFVSSSLMNEYRKDFSIAFAKGVVIGAGSGNGISINNFCRGSVSGERVESIRRSLRISEGDFVIITVGRICKDKGIFEISEVARSLSSYSDLKFILVGEVEDSFSERIVSEMLPSGNVIHIGYVDDVVPFFALANVHLFLSHREGFGNVAIEAASMGVPTISFDVVGVKDSVLDGISGRRFKFGDTESIVTCLKEFYQCRDTLGAEFSDSRKWVSEHFSNRRVWDSYVEFYKSVSA